MLLIDDEPELARLIAHAARAAGYAATATGDADSFMRHFEESGADLIATAAADAAAQEAAAAKYRKSRAAKRRGGKAHASTDSKGNKRITVTIDTKKPAAGTKSADAGDAKNDAKSKPSARHTAKPSGHASTKPAEKPSAHKPAAKPTAAAAKPAPKGKPKHAASDAKPKH